MCFLFGEKLQEKLKDERRKGYEAGSDFVFDMYKGFISPNDVAHQKAQSYKEGFEKGYQTGVDSCLNSVRIAKENERNAVDIAKKEVYEEVKAQVIADAFAEDHKLVLLKTKYDEEARTFIQVLNEEWQKRPNLKRVKVDEKTGSVYVYTKSTDKDYPDGKLAMIEDEACLRRSFDSDLRGNKDTPYEIVIEEEDLKADEP